MLHSEPHTHTHTHTHTSLLQTDTHTHTRLYYRQTHPAYTHTHICTGKYQGCTDSHSLDDTVLHTERDTDRQTSRHILIDQTHISRSGSFKHRSHTHSWHVTVVCSAGCCLTAVKERMRMRRKARWRPSALNPVSLSEVIRAALVSDDWR